MFLSSRWRAAVLIHCTLLLVPPALPQQPAQTPPNIRISVDRVNVGVVVTDSRGQFVSGLRREDFHVLDNGVEQPITDFFSIDERAQVLLLIEAGPAVYLLQGGHLQAIQALLEGLAPSDLVAIARYNDAPELILAYTPDKLTAAAALDQLRFNLGFGQLNLASSLATALDWLAKVPGKKSLVLLSTGFDTSPSSAAENLLAHLKSTDVRVLAISLGGELRGANPPDKKRSKKDQPPPEKAQAAAEGFAQADEELKAIAEANGGRAYFPRTAKDYAAVYTEIAQLVRHEYNLGFVPPAHDAKLHLIDVRITSSATANSPASGSDAPTTAAYRIDHRQAYVAPPPEHP
ncbi:MAG TPA: VWA domain-containing protein [Candidatus Acidoferrum sp.]|nr:VWA domain-containing protein [Candidatus Acidoferrum sp.]